MRIGLWISMLVCIFWGMALHAQTPVSSFRIFASTSCGHCQALKRYLGEDIKPSDALHTTWYFIDTDKKALQAFYAAERPYLSEINALQVPNMRLCGERFVGFENTSQDRNLLQEAIALCSGNRVGERSVRLSLLAQMYAYQHQSVAFMQGLPALMVLDALHMCAWFVWGMLLLLGQTPKGACRSPMMLAVFGISFVHALGLFFPAFYGYQNPMLKLLTWVMGALFFALSQRAFNKYAFHGFVCLCLPALLFYYQQQCQPSFSGLLSLQIVKGSLGSKTAVYGLILASFGYFLLLLGFSQVLVYLYKKIGRPDTRPYLAWGLWWYGGASVVLMMLSPKLLSDWSLSVSGLLGVFLMCYLYEWRFGIKPR